MRKHLEEPHIHRRLKKETAPLAEERQWDAATHRSVELQRAAEGIRKAAQSKCWDAAHAAFLTACEPDADLYATIIDAAKECGMHDKGSMLFREMGKTNVEPNAAAYVSAVELLAETGAHEEAHELWQRALRKGAHVMHEPGCLSGLLTADATRAAVDCAEEDMAAVWESTGIEPDRDAYLSLLKVYKQAADGEGAFGCVDRMRQAGIQPGIKEFTEVLGACRRELLKVPDECREHDYLSRIESQMVLDGIKPDGHFMEERLAMCLGVRRLAEAPGGPTENRSRPADMKMALTLIERAKSIEGGLTPALRKVQQELMKLQKPGPHGVEVQVLVGGSKDRGPQTQ